MNKLYDLFALGGAYRNNTDADCILLFKEAYAQNGCLANALLAQKQKN